MLKFLKVIEPLVLLVLPAVIFLCGYFGIEQTLLLTIAVAICSITPFFLRFELKRPRPRDIMPIVTLTAVATAGRIIFSPFPNFKPVTSIVIISGICFGRQAGFLTGSLTALTSNMFFGQGPFTPAQMYCWGLIGYLAGILGEKGLFKNNAALQNFAVCVFGVLMSLFYGFLMDSWHIVSFLQPVTAEKAAVTYTAGLPMNISHAAATVLFLLPLYLPFRKKLERVKKKYGIL